MEFVPIYNTNPSEVSCEFDVLRDTMEVEGGLSVDITDMMETGVVKDSGEDLAHNDIDDPTNIIGLVRDEFAAIDAQRLIKKYGKKNKSAANDAVKDAVSSSAPVTDKSDG